MLKIVHVSSFRHTVKGAGLFGVPRKLSRGLTRLGHQVIDFSDRDVARGSGFLGSRRLGAIACNRALIRLCRDFAPEVLLLGHADLIRPATVAEIRTLLPGLRVAQWNVDPLFEPDNLARIQSKLEVVDWTFISTGQPALRAALRGNQAAYLPNPADRAVERLRNFEQAALPWDLLFAVGNGRDIRHHAGRATTGDDVAALIRAKLPRLRCAFGGVRGCPHLFGQNYEAALAASAIGLNFSRRGDVPLYSSDRMAQLAGNGLLVVTDQAAGFDALFGDDEMAFYRTEEEMLALLARFASDTSARMAVAGRGWAAYHACFGAERVARYMLDVLHGALHPEKFAWRV